MEFSLNMFINEKIYDKSLVLYFISLIQGGPRGQVIKVANL